MIDSQAEAAHEEEQKLGHLIHLIAQTASEVAAAGGGNADEIEYDLLCKAGLKQFAQ